MKSHVLIVLGVVLAMILGTASTASAQGVPLPTATEMFTAGFRWSNHSANGGNFNEFLAQITGTKGFDFQFALFQFGGVVDIGSTDLNLVRSLVVDAGVTANLEIPLIPGPIGLGLFFGVNTGVKILVTEAGAISTEAFYWFVEAPVGVRFYFAPGVALAANFIFGGDLGLTRSGGGTPADLFVFGFHVGLALRF